MNICEIVLYLTKYIENNNDRDKNLARCKTFGVVELLNENSPICIIRSKRPGRESNTCVIAKYVKEKELIGKTVVIIEEEANNNPQTRNQYPYLAKKYNLWRNETVPSKTELFTRLYLLQTPLNRHIFAASISETTSVLTLQNVCGGKR